MSATRNPCTNRSSPTYTTWVKTILGAAYQAPGLELSTSVPEGLAETLWTDEVCPDNLFNGSTDAVVELKPPRETCIAMKPYVENLSWRVIYHYISTILVNHKFQILMHKIEISWKMYVEPLWSQDGTRGLHLVTIGTLSECPLSPWPQQSQDQKLHSQHQYTRIVTGFAIIQRWKFLRSALTWLTLGI